MWSFMIDPIQDLAKVYDHANFGKYILNSRSISKKKCRMVILVIMSRSLMNDHSRSCYNALVYIF